MADDEMASSGEGTRTNDSFPPWHHKSDNSLVSKSPEYRDLLRKKRPELVEIVRDSPLWARLRSLLVVDRQTQEELQLNAPRYRIIERLLDYIEKGPIWRLHAFMRACAQTHQEHVVDLLGLDLAKYTVDECEEY